MRKLLLALSLLAFLCSPALAGKNAGGSLIVHTNDTRNFTTVGLCARFETLDSPGSCEAAGTRTDKDEATPALIWLVAAFDQTAVPGVSVIYFGLNHNLPPGQGFFANAALCGPAGSIEVPDSGWPDTGGNSVAFGSPVVGDTFFPYYYLNAFGFAGAFVGTGINPTGGYAAFVDDSNPPIQDLVNRFGTVRWGAAGENLCPIPPVITGACCFPDGSCQEVEASQCTGNYLGDNTVCSPNPCDQPEACCFDDGHCEELLTDLCAQQGGNAMGPGTTCTPGFCPIPGACCFADGTCQFLPEVNCLGLGGTWQQGVACEPNPCDQPALPGACCFPAGNCEFILEADCVAAGGQFQGEGVSCNDANCPQPPTGACCVDNECSITTEADCTGAYQGDNTPCDPNPCVPPPPTGACCIDLKCSITTEADCTGSYQGDDTTCKPNPCIVVPTGACCVDTTCTVTTQAECTGNYQGDNTTCDPNPCLPPPTGACCIETDCTITTQVDCTGNYQGDNTTCDPNPCLVPPTGACCIETDCSVTTQGDCTGNYQGDNTTCDPNPCLPPPPTGACCIETDCSITTQGDCAGNYQGDNTTCDPNPCLVPPQPGACCFPAGNCEFLLEVDCVEAGGQFQGEGVSCNDANCPQPPTGACCVDNECSITTAADCTGDYQGDDTTCEPDPCLPPPPTGACCIETECTITTQGDCTGNYQGDGTTCEPNPCLPPPPEFIRGDVNADGNVNIQDIWLCMLSNRQPTPPCRDAADFNDSGTLDRTDCAAELQWLFGNGNPPPPPYPECGPDPTEDALDCANYPPCAPEGVHGIGTHPTSEASLIASVHLRNQVAADGASVLIPIVLDAGHGLAAFELAARFDPTVLQFQGISRGSLSTEFDFVSGRQAGSAGTVRIGGITDLELETTLGAGVHPIGQLVFRVLKPAALEGTRIEVTGGTVVEADGASSEVLGEATEIRGGTEQTAVTLKPGFSLPNPIRPNGAILLELPEAAPVQIDVYNVNGQRIRNLVTADMTKGRHEVRWDGRTESGQEAGPGIYYLRAAIGATEIVKKIALVR